MACRGPRTQCKAGALVQLPQGLKRAVHKGVQGRMTPKSRGSGGALPAALLLLYLFPVGAQQEVPPTGMPVNATAYCQNGQEVVGFISGVASGDATQDAVVIWSRFQPPDNTTSYPIDWVVSTQPSLTPATANGTLTASPDADFTVKMDVKGLHPNTTYYYAFRQGNYSSPLGRTKTLPPLDGDVRQLRYAILSCANYGYGFFNVYDLVARVKDLDLVIFLGDWIYEYNSTYYPSEREKVRKELIPPHELYSMRDYHQRHRLYRIDPSLQELLRRVPIYAIWDDHDAADNDWKDGSLDTQDTAVWNRRETDSATAFKHYLPVRSERDGLFSLYRSFTFGDMATIVLPETRLQYRTKQLDPRQHPYIKTLEENDPDKWDSLPQLPELKGSYIDALKAPNLTQIGPQLQWVEQDLAESKAGDVTWQIFASPTIFSPRRTPDIQTAIDDLYGRLVTSISNAFLNFATGNIAAEQLQFGGSARAMVGTGKYHDTLLTDSWDGYQYERGEILNAFENSTNNAVVVTGDSHNAWASNLYGGELMQLTLDGGVNLTGPIVGVEFATASVTAPGIESYVDIIPFGNVLGVLEKGLFLSNPDLVYANLKDRGTVILTTTKEAMQGDYVYVSTIEKSNYDPTCQKSFKVVAGQMSQGLQNATCTPLEDLLFQLYTTNDPLPQNATLTAPAFPQAAQVSNCGGSDATPPFIPVTFENPASEERGREGRDSEGEEESGGIVNKVAKTVSNWFG